jgi:hypothetical protein
MEIILLVVIGIAVLAYYGFMGSLETGAKMANREVEHLDDVHMASMVARTAKMADKISDDDIKKAEEVKAKLAVMRGES